MSIQFFFASDVTGNQSSHISKSLVIEEEHFQDNLRNLNTHKSMGLDKMNSRVSGKLTDEIIKLLYHIWKVLGDWEKREYYNHYKKGNEKDPGNYELHLCAWQDYGTDYPGNYDKDHRIQGQGSRENQHGFTKVKFHLTYLTVAFKDGVTASMNKWRGLVIVYLIFCKIFDMDPHIFTSK